MRFSHHPVRTAIHLHPVGPCRSHKASSMYCDWSPINVLRASSCDMSCIEICRRSSMAASTSPPCRPNHEAYLLNMYRLTELYVTLGPPNVIAMRSFRVRIFTDLGICIIDLELRSHMYIASCKCACTYELQTRPLGSSRSLRQKQSVDCHCTNDCCFSCSPCLAICTRTPN